MSIRSWDCFDTLLGRKFFYPRSIFDIISEKTGDIEFKNKRILAEQHAVDKTLYGIYDNIKDHDPDLELEIEKEFTFPIRENFDNVRDGDIVVSDMYLSDNQIHDLLLYHGLNKDITVYSTYGGKRKGYVWETIKKKHPNVSYHTGDNIQSDILSARKNGIKAVYYHGGWSIYEKTIADIDPIQAALMRFMRLSTPMQFAEQKLIHDDGSIQHVSGLTWIEEIRGNINHFFLKDNNNDSIILSKIYKNAVVKISKEQQSAHYTLDKDKWYSLGRDSSSFWDFDQQLVDYSYDKKMCWHDQSQFNIPILVNFLCMLPHKEDLVFIYRDCVYLQMLYDAIFSHGSKGLHVSRSAYKKPFNKEYIDYVLKTAKHSVMVDLHGSGQSTNTFFANHNADDYKILFLCGHHKQIKTNEKNRYCLICNKRYPKYRNMTGSKKKRQTCRGSMLEKLNMPHEMGNLIGWEGKPIRQNPSEHNPIISESFNNAVGYAANNILPYITRWKPNMDVVDFLMTALVKEETYTDNMVTSLWNNNRHPLQAKFFRI